MAHNNIEDRRRHIAGLMTELGELTAAKKMELARLYGCSYGAIYSDIALIKNPAWIQKYRATHQVASENGRARQLGIPGNINTDDWRNLCEKYGNTCLACGQYKPLVIDHVVPASKGGSNAIGNIQPKKLSWPMRQSRWGTRWATGSATGSGSMT